MKAKQWKRMLAIGLSAVMTLSILTGCGEKESGNSGNADAVGETAKQSTEQNEEAGQTESDKPDTWIADRTIVMQVYVDDIGYDMPDNVNDTLVMQELTRRTGIKIDVRYTPGDSDSMVMAAQLASGNIPDMIVGYLNDSTRKEFPIISKAAREGLFADLSEMMKNTKVYSKYYEEGYLPKDTYNNIVFRDDFGGAVYFLHLQISEVDRSGIWDPNESLVGGMYIQKRIVDDLGIDPTSIRTQDQLYDLLVRIKEAGYTDDNGNEVWPMGPRYWGGNAESQELLAKNDNWGVSDDYNITEDGKVLHEAETDYVYKKIAFYKKLLDENLVNTEFFTMDATRAEEVSKSKNSAIIANVHSYVDVIYGNEDWLPLGPLEDIDDFNGSYYKGKNGYGFAAISSEAENPEEILAFLDYLSTYEGQLLIYYGIEGVTYDMVDGYPVLKDEVKEKIEAGDKEYQRDVVGARFGGDGLLALEFLVTNRNNIDNFGESRPGIGATATFDRAVELATEYPREMKLLEGLNATAYLNTEELAEVKANLELLNYDEMLVQAIFEKNDAEVTKIVENFRSQLKAAGVEEFEAHLEEVYAEDPSAINFIPHN